jgi:hypothetical protein
MWCAVKQVGLLLNYDFYCIHYVYCNALTGSITLTGSMLYWHCIAFHLFEYVGDWLVCWQLLYLFYECFDLDIMFLILYFDTVGCYTSRLSVVVLNTHNYNLHTYIPLTLYQWHLRYSSEMTTFYHNYSAMSNTADVTGGKAIAV